MLVGFVFAAVSGIVCIHFLIRFIERIGLLPFTIYRLLLAALIVWHFT
jgi:undecaprenyl-diphosphatase